MVFDVVVDDDELVVILTDTVDDDMRRRTSQRVGADRFRIGVGHPVGHENADLIRERIPSSGWPTASPRPSANSREQFGLASR